MEQSLLAAVSGIEADQTYLNVIGNNVANANTTAYKSENAEFEDLLTEQLSGASAPVTGETAGVDPMDVGSGVQIGAVTEDLTEGTTQQTGVPSDVAIQGNGYLEVTQGGETYFTRNGQLQLDENGDLSTLNGGLVQGWMANTDGVIDTNAPTGPVTIPTNETMPATATTEITLGGNLPADAAAAQQPSTINVYDSLGNVVPVTITYTPLTATTTPAATGPDQWSIQGTVTDPATGDTEDLWPAADPPIITFTASGSAGPPAVPVGGIVGISAYSGTAYAALTPNADGSWSLPATTMPAGFTFPTGDTWNFNFPAAGSTGALTQFAGSESVTTAADGYATGGLASYSIGSDGIITGSFTNGETLSIGQIALANFSNPSGLELDGNTLYSVTANSGQPEIGTPGTGGRGTLVGSSLESSNVDLASQLTDLIVAQESYSANTKVISTTSQNLQTLTEMA